jgi:hypothetical protein
MTSTPRFRSDCAFDSSWLSTRSSTSVSLSLSRRALPTRPVAPVISTSLVLAMFRSPYGLCAAPEDNKHPLETDHASAAPICERAATEGHRLARPAPSGPQYRLGINANQDASESESPSRSMMGPSHRTSGVGGMPAASGPRAANRRCLDVTPAPCSWCAVLHGPPRVRRPLS